MKMNHGYEEIELKNAFDTIDKSKKGKNSLKEVKNLNERCGFSISKEGFNLITKGYDTNQD